MDGVLALFITSVEKENDEQNELYNFIPAATKKKPLFSEIHNDVSLC